MHGLGDVCPRCGTELDLQLVSEEVNKTDKPNLPFVTRAFNFNCISLLCLALTFGTFEVGFMFGILGGFCLAPIGGILAILGIVSGIEGKKNHEKLANLSIVFSVINILGCIWLFVYFNGLDTRGWTG
jgi:hypothetical protein